MRSKVAIKRLRGRCSCTDVLISGCVLPVVLLVVTTTIRKNVVVVADSASFSPSTRTFTSSSAGTSRSSSTITRGEYPTSGRTSFPEKRRKHDIRTSQRDCGEKSISSSLTQSKKEKSRYLTSFEREINRIVKDYRTELEDVVKQTQTEMLRRELEERLYESQQYRERSERLKSNQSWASKQRDKPMERRQTERKTTNDLLKSQQQPQSAKRRQRHGEEMFATQNEVVRHGWRASENRPENASHQREGLRPSLASTLRAGSVRMENRSLSQMEDGASKRLHPSRKRRKDAPVSVQGAEDAQIPPVARQQRHMEQNEMTHDGKITTLPWKLRIETNGPFVLNVEGRSTYGNKADVPSCRDRTNDDTDRTRDHNDNMIPSLRLSADNAKVPELTLGEFSSRNE